MPRRSYFGGSTSVWTTKGATLSDKNAKAMFDITQDEIHKGIEAGKLQYKHGSCFGSSYLKLVLSEVRAWHDEIKGDDGIKKRKIKTQETAIRSCAREITQTKGKLKELEKRKIHLEKELKELKSETEEEKEEASEEEEEDEGESEEEEEEESEKEEKPKKKKRKVASKPKKAKKKKKNVEEEEYVPKTSKKRKRQEKKSTVRKSKRAKKKSD